jgi:predicted amidohydrolase
MSTFRIALANLRFPSTPEESVALAVQAIADAANARAGLICFPECFVPGYRGHAKSVSLPDATFLKYAWSTIAAAAAKAKIGVILGTERVSGNELFASALVINQDGTTAGFQDKVQLAPSEDGLYTPGTERLIFQAGPLTFGIAICHESWRYPETVRWAARRGAQVVFNPYFREREPNGYVPTAFAEAGNSFNEKAMLCRAAENSCYFASVNYASPEVGATSAIANPDGTVLSYQPYGKEGLLVADVDLSAATGLFASRCKYCL